MDVENKLSPNCNNSNNLEFNFELIQPQVTSPDIQIPEINAQLQATKDLTGRSVEISVSNNKYFKQILPQNILLQANNRFCNLDPEQKEIFLELLRNFSENPLAISTLFSIIAYDSDHFSDSASSPSLFSELTSEGNIEKFKKSLEKSENYFKSQHNFQQSYLNTRVGVSTFSILADSFCYNKFVLGKMIELQLNELQAPNNNKDQPAYSSHSWLKAPTIIQEYNRRVQQCQKGISDVLNSKNNFDKKSNFNNLTQTFERLSAITGRQPVLLSKRLFQSFTLSCIMDVVLTILAKIFSFGFYKGSLNLDERLEGVNPKKSKIVQGNDNKYFEQQNIQEIWENTFKYGMTLESRDLGITDHSIAIKAIIDSEGKRYLEVHDPLKKKVEKIEVK